MTRHIAFDLGLRKTGICWDGDARPVGSDHHVSPAKVNASPMTDARKAERLAWWHDTFRMILVAQPEWTPVVIEAPILGRKNPTGSIETIKLHGLLQGICVREHHPITWVNNKTLKAWATGDGNATKADMVAAARARGWVGDSEDEADAVLLWHHVAAVGL